MKKLIGVFLIAVMSLSLILSGCNKKINAGGDVEKEDSEDNESKNISIIWWGGDSRAEKTKEVIKMYTEENKNVTIEEEFLDWGEYWDKLSLMSASNDLPDIIQQDYSAITDFANKNWITDITPFIDDGTLNTENVSEDVLNSGKVGEKLVGICLGINSQVLIYDTELFKKAGTSLKDNMPWEDYLTAIKTVYEKTGVPASIPFAAAPKRIIEFWVRSYGYSLFSEDGKSLGFDDAKILESYFQVEQDMINDKIVFSPAKEISTKSTEDLPIVTGESSVNFAWSNMLVQISDAAGRDLSVVSFPSPSESKRPGMYMKPSMFFSIAESSEDKKSAAEFINYFTNDVEANKILDADRGIPISSDVSEKLKESVGEASKKSFEYVGRINDFVSPIDPPEPSTAPDVTTLITDINNEVLYLKLTPAEAAEKFMSEANSILSE
jgi:multiple sugar transport system substrate-binding protein